MTKKEYRLVEKEFSPSCNKNYFGTNAWNMVWTVGCILEIKEKIGDLVKVMAVPNGRMLYADLKDINDNTIMVTYRRTTDRKSKGVEGTSRHRGNESVNQ